MKHKLMAILFCLVWVVAPQAAAEEFGKPVRVEIITPGGALPFIMYSELEKFVKSSGDAPGELVLYTVIKNGEERVRVSLEDTVIDSIRFGPTKPSRYGLTLQSGRIFHTTKFVFKNYDSELEWTTWSGRELQEYCGKYDVGTWRKRRGEHVVELPVLFTELEDGVDEFTAERFVPIPRDFESDLEFEVDYSGRWRVEFDSADDHAIGIFEVDENQIATGTFLTQTGDYRYLEGRVDGPYLRLSTFDGAHAFLFHAEMKSKDKIEGDFWSGNWHHETWTAVRDENATLPDAFEQTTVTDEQALADAVFKDIDGNPTRVLDALDETKAKARVLEIFGTWCPNCSDAGRELVSLKSKYGDDLGIVALAFEVTEDFERSSQQVQRHHAHIGSDWEILIAGLSDKAKATETLGFLDKVRSYPTLIFLNERNEVQAVYSGFSGPATGDAYTQQRERFEALIERMINE